MPQPGTLELELLEEAYRTISLSYDSIRGLSAALKFPVPVKLRSLLQLDQWPQAVTDILGPTATVIAAFVAVTTLPKMARGGIRTTGFGFPHDSVTVDWSFAHFQKMLYDQALLLGAYLDAFLTTHDAEMLGTIWLVSAERAATFIKTEMHDAPSRLLYRVCARAAAPSAGSRTTTPP